MKKHFPVLEQLNAASLITSLSVVLGTLACHLALTGRLGAAVLCGALALPCDVFDGQVARRLNQVSAFGGFLDSLADAVSFCLVPPMLAHAMGVGGVWTVALVAYSLTGVWRLARFMETGTVVVAGRECFQGLPTAHGAAVFYLVAAGAAGLPDGARSAVVGGYLAVAALGMIHGFTIPKQGWHTRMLWGLVPVATVASAVRWW